jgi:hypothetical protein
VRRSFSPGLKFWTKTCGAVKGGGGKHNATAIALVGDGWSRSYADGAEGLGGPILGSDASTFAILGGGGVTIGGTGSAITGIGFVKPTRGSRSPPTWALVGLRRRGAKRLGRDRRDCGLPIRKAKTEVPVSPSCSRRRSEGKCDTD